MADNKRGVVARMDTLAKDLARLISAEASATAQPPKSSAPPSSFAHDAEAVVDKLAAELEAYKAAAS